MGAPGTHRVACGYVEVGNTRGDAARDSTYGTEFRGKAFHRPHTASALYGRHLRGDALSSRSQLDLHRSAAALGHCRLLCGTCRRSLRARLRVQETHGRLSALRAYPDDGDRVSWQTEHAHRQVVVWAVVRLAGRFHHDDRQCGRTRDGHLSAIDQDAEDELRRHQCVVLHGGEPAESATPDLRVAQHHASLVRGRSLLSALHRPGRSARLASGALAARKDFPSLHHHSHLDLCHPDADLINFFFLE